VNGCEDTYASDATGIGPEEFRWVTDTTAANDTNNPGPPADQQEFYEKAGFFITSGVYILRPEVIESFYYAYRATGDEKYQNWAWNAFVAINSTCRVGSGFAELENVNVAGGGGFNDFQDSFLFAEVMKYSYLIHAPVSHQALKEFERCIDESQDNVFQTNHNGVNEFVFNTEAHPVKVAGSPI
jgi:mannosyl-oligosaccharide alpha-1,2-mannosidase